MPPAHFSFFIDPNSDGGRRPGFPIAEVSAGGSAVHPPTWGNGGAVTVETCDLPLLYEICSPRTLPRVRPLLVLDLCLA